MLGKSCTSGGIEYPWFLLTWRLTEFETLESSPRIGYDRWVVGQVSLDGHHVRFTVHWTVRFSACWDQSDLRRIHNFGIICSLWDGVNITLEKCVLKSQFRNQGNESYLWILRGQFIKVPFEHFGSSWPWGRKPSYHQVCLSSFQSLILLKSPHGLKQSCGKVMKEHTTRLLDKAACEEKGLETRAVSRMTRTKDIKRNL